jgi:hypothetical protein
MGDVRFRTTLGVALVCAIVFAWTGGHAGAQSTASHQDQAAAHGNPLVPASNAALVDLMTKNFEHMNKLEPIPIAVVHDGNSDVDLQTWPGSLITEKLKHVEIECGVEFRPVSMDSDYRVLLALGKPGTENLIVREDIVRQKYFKELRRLLGSDQRRIGVRVEFFSRREWSLTIPE